MQRFGGEEELAVCETPKGMAALTLGGKGLLKQVRSMMKYVKGHAVLLLLSSSTSWRQADK